MRGLFATAIAIALGLVLSTGASAQDKDAKDRPEKSSNRGSQGDMGTIHGVVAGVTVEGELVIDYKTKRAVEVDAAFLTVVGSPAKWNEGSAEQKTGEKAIADGKSGSTQGDRKNIYMVFLSPRTKVCECEECEASGKPVAGKTKACDLDRLQVGDRVEIKYVRRDESTSTAGANHTEGMRAKHGRHRILAVDAQEVTILPSKQEEHSSSGAKETKSK
jgi:hypothetical protein